MYILAIFKRPKGPTNSCYVLRRYIKIAFIYNYVFDK